jgi:hypothetical protein
VAVRAIAFGDRGLVEMNGVDRGGRNQRGGL